MWDAFLSHAGEDKTAFVEPLAKELENCGLSVWYDDFELSVGDSIPNEIRRGLHNSDFGVVILSEAFFEKSWTQEELDSLIQRDVNEKDKVILPVCYDITPEDVQFHHKLLGKRYLISGDSMSVPEVAQELYQEILETRTKPLNNGDLEDFDPETLDYIAELIGEIKRGTEIENFFQRLNFDIDWDDAKEGSIDEWISTFPVEAKERGVDLESERKRTILENLKDLNEEDPSNIISIIEKLIHPRHYIENDKEREQIIKNLNNILRWEDLRIVDQGEVKKLT
ncbi:toll/interleukin-1 receptor domain-containing protein [Haloarcula onubensis]|uniref:ADP-ribosyl cyclase/cyclic ADP-ribose hydrolase n=1 Tax=Haloarcula onubensis TaxID=2950539 RepID=A0ABU2FT88_9EURY|nr:toll/interleukin-1 receptor domain-containing protein [Halomicroarcula sp. S3CR25-11]MDS0283978.1 toll/interleukin-1 receptor domain-containing protein [Halomicroarcula sp. S3CR25-11]